MYLIGMLATSGPLAMWFPENINPLAIEIDRLHDIILAMIGVVLSALAWRCFGLCGNTTRPPIPTRPSSSTVITAWRFGGLRFRL